MPCSLLYSAQTNASRVRRALGTAFRAYWAIPDLNGELFGDWHGGYLVVGLYDQRHCAFGGGFRNDASMIPAKALNRALLPVAGIFSGYW